VVRYFLLHVRIDESQRTKTLMNERLDIRSGYRSPYWKVARTHFRAENSTGPKCHSYEISSALYTNPIILLDRQIKYRDVREVVAVSGGQCGLAFVAGVLAVELHPSRI